MVTVSITISSTQTAWSAITPQYTFKQPKGGMPILLDALSAKSGIVGKVYVISEGILYNTNTPLDYGYWYINGAYLIN